MKYASMVKPNTTKIIKYDIIIGIRFITSFTRRNWTGWPMILASYVKKISHENHQNKDPLIY